MSATSIKVVIPSRIQVGQAFEVKLRVLGEPRAIPVKGQFRTPKPGLETPYNLNVERQIQYVDNTAEDWRGDLLLAGEDYDGPTAVPMDGRATGIYQDDRRPIRVLGGCRFTAPGFHFLRVYDPVSGLEGWSNPTLVTTDAPDWQIAWGDPHTHTFFTDGIRCPEDVYHFARHEGFLDFCALSDHSEGITDGQWLYFQAVTNAANEAGRFVTLIGQEWTNHIPDYGAPGHRNIYVPGDAMPILRCTDPGCHTLDELWAQLDQWEQPVLALPHHSANVIMGTDWAQAWNPKYERAVEIYSVWGNSERPASAGNPRPILGAKGEMAGRHVQDALRQGRRMSFIGGGDTHDGRPGDALHRYSYPPRDFEPWEQGFTAARVPSLTRQHVFDAIAHGQTYATTASRIYLDVQPQSETTLRVQTASEQAIRSIELVMDGEDRLRLEQEAWTADLTLEHPALTSGSYVYVRVTTGSGDMAWSSPIYGPRA